MTKYLAVFQNETIPQAYGISGQGLKLVDNNGIFMKNSKCMQNNEIFLQG